MFKMSRSAIEMMAKVTDGNLYVRQNVVKGMLSTIFGTSSAKGSVEIQIERRNAEEGEEPNVANYAFAELKAAAASGEAEVAFVNGSLQVDGMALTETNPPADVFTHGAVKQGSRIYDGNVSDMDDATTAKITPEVKALMSERTCVYESKDEIGVLSQNGVLVILSKVTPIAEEPEEFPDFEAMAAVDAAIRSGAATYDEAVAAETEEETEDEPSAEETEPAEEAEEIPFDLADEPNPAPATKEEPKKADKPKPKNTKKEEPKMSDVVVVKLFNDERAAFQVAPKTLSNTLEHVLSVCGGGKVQIVLPGEGKKVIGLLAYKEPVQIKAGVVVDATAGTETKVSVEVDRFANIVRSLIGVEDTIRIGITDAEVKLSGSEVRLTFPIVSDAPLLDETLSEGLGVAIHASSLSASLRASVCATKDEKAQNGLDAILFTVKDNGNRVEVYSSDSFAVSRALMKGRAQETEDRRFSVPTVIRSIKWPDAEDAKPVQMSFGEKLLGITLPGRQYLIRYKAKQMPVVESVFERANSVTKIVVRSGELKDRINLLLSATTDDKKPVTFEVKGASVTARVPKQEIAVGTFGKTTGEQTAKFSLNPKMLLRTISAFGQDDILTVGIGEDMKTPIVFSNKDETLQVLQLQQKEK